MLSPYIADLQTTLAATPEAFVATWTQFRDTHHPGDSHGNCLLQLMALIHPQLPKGQSWGLFLKFCAARMALGPEDFERHRVCWDADTLLTKLSQMLAITPGEMAEVCTQCAALAPPEEAWQFDRVLNAMHWQSGPPTHILARQTGLLQSGRISSLYGLKRHKPAHGRPAPSLGPSGPIELVQPEHAERWDLYGWGMRGAASPTIVSPFCYDTNHLDGAGLFQLLAGIRLGEGYQAIDLTGARMRLKMHADLSIPNARLHLGVGGRDPTDLITDEALARTGYVMLTKPLDWITPTVLSADVDLDTASWEDLGRNPSSPAFFAFAAVPAADILRHARNLFLILMHDGSTEPITGSFRVDNLVLERP